MKQKKNYMPVKVLVSYLALVGLVGVVGWILYTENLVFSATESKVDVENNKMLKVSNLLSNMYKTESFARIAIQSNDEADFENYLDQANLITSEIDSLKSLVANDYQAKLLDSVNILLAKKTQNIAQLKIIKEESDNEEAITNAINKITQMEGTLRKLRVDDFVENPEELKEYQKEVIRQMVEVLNQNIPNDNTNTLTQAALDSMLIASKTALSDVVRARAKRNESLSIQESKLQENELSISEQLRKILGIIEREIILNTTQSNIEKEQTLQKTNEIVTYAAVIGLILTVFFSVLIVNDFAKSQSYKLQLERANAQTQKLLKNREQLISTVSHDLKTPLSTIVGYAELLGNSNLSTKQDYYTKNIRGSSEYISKLVQDLLDFTQIEAGKITIESLPFSLPDVIHQVAKSVQAVHSQKKIDLQIDIDPAFTRNIVGDPFRLRQILTNLIGNAYKFTESGFIRIEGIPAHDKMILKIKDSGIGIQESSQKLIFEEFTQADESIEKTYGGTGLGLTISKKMAEILGGKLQMESVFGSGSTFTIEVPLVFSTSDFPSAKAVNTKKEYKPINAIVIDDDANLLRLTTEVLQQNMFTVHAFNNAKEALAAMKNKNFDLVVTDIQMPGMDGFSFLENLKKESEIYKQQPVVAVTGRGDLPLESYHEAGFATVIRKPYSPQKFLETIEAILKNEAVTENSEPQIYSNAPYSVADLQAFMPNDPDALKEVLSSFVKITHQTLADFEQAVKAGDIEQIKVLSHRMYPMFKQLKANKIAEILENLESDEDLEQKDLPSIFNNLKNKIEDLFELFRKDLVI